MMNSKDIIVFNALQTSLSGGIGRYSYELSKALYKMLPNNIKIVIREEDINLFKFAKKEALIIAANIKNSRMRNIYEQFKLPKIIYDKYPSAIIHYPDSMAPLFSKNKVVITIHDLAFISRKNDVTLKKFIWKSIITKLSVKKANKIICITNFAKNEVSKYYPKFLDKVKVVYNGFNDFSHEDIVMDNIRSEIKEKVKIKYIFTISTISPRKNIDGLIRAFYLCKNSTDYNLIIAGANGWKYDEIYNLVNEYDISDRIYFTGKVNEDELKYLYKNAGLFVYPSFYEGFGLPPLEAISFEVPCIVSNTTSLPEVLGKFGVYINPNDSNDISNTILRILKDDNLRSDIISRQKNIIKYYSWSTCAESTMGVYSLESWR